MSSNPYGDKPSLISDANQWHELSFQISIDRTVDWDKVDLRKWVTSVAKFTALLMAKSMITDDDIDEDTEVIKTLIMAVKASRISFVTDDELHSMIDEFGDE